MNLNDCSMLFQNATRNVEVLRFLVVCVQFLFVRELSSVRHNHYRNSVSNGIRQSGIARPKFVGRLVVGQFRLGQWTNQQIEKFRIDHVCILRFVLSQSGTNLFIDAHDRLSLCPRRNACYRCVQNFFQAIHIFKGILGKFIQCASLSR